MTGALLVGMVVLSVLVVLVFGAVVELHRQVLQLRMHAGLVDDAAPLDFDPEVSIADLAIPAGVDIEGHERTAVLVLSDSCTTCVEVGRHFAGKPTSGLMAVVEARSLSDAAGWISTQGLKHGANLVYDEGGRIADLLGVKVTPAVVKFEGDRPVAASTVPSTRQLDLVIDWLAGRGSETRAGVG